MAQMACRNSPLVAETQAFSRARPAAGASTSARTPMMTVTRKSSYSVKPRALGREHARVRYKTVLPPLVMRPLSTHTL